MPVEPVVVTGIGVSTAAGTGVAAFTAALRGGIRPAAEEGVLRLGHFDFVDRLRGLELPAAVAAAARQAARRAPLSAQLSLCTALEAWCDAGLATDGFYRPEDVSLIVAGQNLAQGHGYELAEQYRSRLDFVPASHALHFMDTDQVGRISEVLGIRGEGFTTGGASASGNVGLIQGMRLITGGHARACVVVGAMTELSPLEIHSLRNMGAMSSEGFCRPFDRDRRGFVYAQGSGCLVLESADGARARGRAGRGLLRGGAQCLDGNRSSDPRADGETRAMRMALANAGLEARDVDYVNTHGTGSALGDQVEYDSVRAVFGPDFPRVWLNSTKAITGHCLSAAGVVEAAGALIQMSEGFLHPTVGLENPIGAEGRFVGPDSREVACRFALSNGFGFGGINTSIVMERS